MADLGTTTETEEFIDELSDEALDRREKEGLSSNCNTKMTISHAGR